MGWREISAKLFIYETPMVLSVNNWALQATHYFFQISIMLYIIIYVCIIQRAYMVYDIVQGTISFGVPKSAPKDFNITNYPYCGNPKPCGPVLPYQLIRFMGPAFFIPSRVANATVDVYVPSVEDLEVLIKCYTVAYPGRSDIIDDRLLQIDFKTRNGKETVSFPVGTDTRLTIGKILHLAGSSYDDVGNATSRETIRETGGWIVGVLMFTNVPSSVSLSGTQPLRAEGTFYLLQKSRHQQRFVFPDVNPASTAKKIKNYGLEVSFIITGTFGRFDFNYGFIQLMTNLALLTVSTAVIDATFFRFSKTLRRLKYIENKVWFAGLKNGFLVDTMSSEGGDSVIENNKQLMIDFPELDSLKGCETPYASQNQTTGAPSRCDSLCSDRSFYSIPDPN